MQNFHEDKLWQASYVALMDIHEVLDTAGDSEGEIAQGLLSSAKDVASKIADGLSRLDHRIGRNLMYDAIGLVAITRTQLAVAWGRGILPDDIFKKLDDQYASLSSSLQSYK